MSTLKKHIKSDKLKWVITFVSIALILGLLISVIVGLSNLQPTKNVGSLDYSISSIDTTTGKVIDSNQNIVMKNLGNVDGMEITLDEDAQITYKVAFYDENKDFVSITDKQSTDFDAESIPATAKYSLFSLSFLFLPYFFTPCLDFCYTHIAIITPTTRATPRPIKKPLTILF